MYGTEITVRLCLARSPGTDMAVFCLLCAKRFQTQKALQQHMEAHAGMHSYICSHCERPFPSHTTLKRHLRSHTGKRRIICTILIIHSVSCSHKTRTCRCQAHAYVKEVTRDSCIYFGIWVNFLGLLALRF